jgi:hypothetical protein
MFKEPMKVAHPSADGTSLTSGTGGVIGDDQFVFSLQSPDRLRIRNAQNYASDFSVISTS